MVRGATEGFARMGWGWGWKRRAGDAAAAAAHPLLANSELPCAAERASPWSASQMLFVEALSYVYSIIFTVTYAGSACGTASMQCEWRAEEGRRRGEKGRGGEAHLLKEVRRLGPIQRHSRHAEAGESVGDGPQQQKGQAACERACACAGARFPMRYQSEHIGCGE